MLCLSTRLDASFRTLEETKDTNLSPESQQVIKIILNTLQVRKQPRTSFDLGILGAYIEDYSTLLHTKYNLRSGSHGFREEEVYES